MKKVLLAMNIPNLSQYISDRLEDYVFVDEAVYRDSIIKRISDTGADIVVILEGLQGSIPMFNIIQRIRMEHSNTRIILICGKSKNINDNKKEKYINMGVYDLIEADELQADNIIELIKKPNTYADAMALLGNKNDNGDIVEEAETPVITAQKSELNSIKPIISGKKPTTPSAIQTTQARTKPPQSVVQPTISQPEEQKRPVIPTVDSIATVEQQPKPKITETAQTSKTVNSYKENEEQKEIVIEKPIEEQMPVFNNMDVGYSYIPDVKIISVLTSVEGCGGSSVAVNIATKIATMGKRVLIVDLNTKNKIASRIKLSCDTQGLEGYIKTHKTENIVKTAQWLFRVTGQDTARIAKLPQSLDYLYNVTDYKINAHDWSVALDLLKKSGHYDYIVVNGIFDVNSNEIINTIKQTDRVINVITQDMYSVNQTANNIYTLRNSGLDISGRTLTVINRYIKGIPDSVAIQQMLLLDNLIPISEDTKGFNRASFNYMPYIIKPDNRQVQKAYDTIVKLVMS